MLNPALLSCGYSAGKPVQMVNGATNVKTIAHASAQTSNVIRLTGIAPAKKVGLEVSAIFAVVRTAYLVRIVRKLANA